MIEFQLIFWFVIELQFCTQYPCIVTPKSVKVFVRRDQNKLSNTHFVPVDDFAKILAVLKDIVRKLILTHISTKNEDLPQFWKKGNKKRKWRKDIELKEEWRVPKRVQSAVICVYQWVRPFWNVCAQVFLWIAPVRVRSYISP